MTRGDEYINSMQEIVSKNIDADMQILCNSLIEHLGFILDTLDGLKDDIDTRGLMIDFKQGKQEIKIINPSFKAYNKLYKTYDSTANVLLKIMDKCKKSASDDLDDF